MICLVFPWISFLQTLGVGGIATFLSDHLVLEVLDFLGKRVDIEQEETVVTNTTTETTIASHTANTGKDAYYVQMGKIVFANTGANTVNFTLRLYINNILQETRVSQSITAGTTSSSSAPFALIDRKFTTGQEFKITAEHGSASAREITYTTNVILYEEDTGVNPLDDFQ